VLTATVEQPDRLDRVLAGVFPGHSRARFQKLIAEGAVTVDGAVISDAALKLRVGQVVQVKVPPPVAAEPAAEDIALDVAFEDKHVIVINKPVGTSTSSSSTSRWGWWCTLPPATTAARWSTRCWLTAAARSPVLAG